MKNRTTKLAAVALLLALGPMAVNAQSSGTHGLNYYEVVIADGINWTAANAAANAKKLNGINGHLATLTTGPEDLFVHGLRNMTPGIKNGQFADSELWVGAEQIPPTSAAGDDWSWVNSEGAFSYTNWDTDEPNDNGGDEHFLAIGIGGAFGWNDEASLVGIWGYVIEYEGGAATFGDGEVDATLCVSGSGVCNTSGVQEFEVATDDGLTGVTIAQELLEPDPPGGTPTECLGLNTYKDPRVGVDGRPLGGVLATLDVFGVLGGGTDGALILDEFTYGSPCFAVVEGSAEKGVSSFDLTNGVVRSTQLPDDVEGIGTVFGCTDSDLQRRTQFTYQTSTRADMIENSAAAMTSGCNSPSRGGSFRFSFFVLNTHEDCGIDFGMAGGSDLVLQCFKDLARGKFDATHKSLKNAKKKLKKPKYGKLQSELSDAKDKFLSDDFDGSLAHLAELLSRVTAAEFKGDFNHQGNLIMRIENLQHRVAEIQAASP